MEGVSRPLANQTAPLPRRHSGRSLAFIRNLWDKHQAKALFLKRSVANGLNKEQVEALLKKADSYKELSGLFSNIFQDHQAQAEYWADIGLKTRARDYYLEAALWAFYAQLLMSDNDKGKAQAYFRCAQSYRIAAPYFTHPGHAIEISYQLGSLKGYLRLPSCEADSPHFPLVIILNSLNSTKEEMYYTESTFLNEGLATLSFDYPGTGESIGSQRQSFNVDALGHSLYLGITSCKEISPSRIALYGISLGGTIALAWAANNPWRFRAVATLSTPYDNHTLRTRLLPHDKRPRTALVEVVSELAHEITQKISVKDYLANVVCPILVASGGRDKLIKAADARLIYDQSAAYDKKLLFCTRAGHGCYEMMPSLRYEIARWIKQRI